MLKKYALNLKNFRTKCSLRESVGRLRRSGECLRKGQIHHGKWIWWSYNVDCWLRWFSESLLLWIISSIENHKSCTRCVLYYFYQYYISTYYPTY